MFKNIINKWHEVSQKYVFKYKDGFFEVPFLGNGGKFFVQAFTKMPFIRHSVGERVFKVKNLFLKGFLFYDELEEGLWVTFSENYFRQNISFRMFVDENHPIDFSIAYTVVSSKLTKNNPIINEFVVKEKIWSFFKPKPQFNSNYYKNSTIENISIYFTQDWARQNFGSLEHLSFMFEKDGNSFFYYELSKKQLAIFEKLKNSYLENRKDVLGIKLITYEILSNFSEFYKSQIKPEKDLLNDNDRIKIINIEKYLLTNLTSDFPGIEVISKKFAVSPTKLKQDFKVYSGQSIYKFFTNKQMESALEILKNENCQVKYVASLFGYENASKFSQAFFNFHGFLPSDLKK